jgi:hypothetical protein
MTDILQASALSADEAERLSSRISVRLDTASDNWSGALQLIREAIMGAAYAALGYRSHGDYVADRFGGSLSKLGIELRREVVRELSDAGLSTRAIAPVFGLSNKTIHQDIHSELLPEVTPEPELEPEFDPTPVLPPHDDGWIAADPATGEVVEPDHITVTEHTVTEKVKTVTGLDGKTYPAAAPTAPRRSSLIDDARNAGWQLRKAIERLERIHQDDRFTKNKVEILAALQPHLDFATETISGL